MKGTLIILTTLLIFAIVGLSACNSQVPSTTLENTTWVLESYGKQGNLQAVLEGNEISAVFKMDEGTVNGSAGCNNYFASYELNGNQLSVSDAGMTMMFCGEPEGIMEQEDKYMTLLQSAKTFQIKNNKLWLFSIDDQVLIFDAE